MADNNDNPDDMARWRANMERDLVDLRRLVSGDLPPEPNTTSIVDRLETIDRSLVALLVASDGQAVQGGQVSDDSSIAPMEVEWGNPSTTPTGESATITVQPCEEDGTPYADADTATLYIRNDRSAADLDGRGWDTDTILSFIRFPWDTTTDEAVGVLVGEGNSSTGDGAPDSGGSFTETYYGNGTVETPSLAYTLAGCADAHLIIGIELRSFTTGTIPAYKLPRMSGGQYQVAWANTIATWDGDDSQWFSLMYCHVSEVGATSHGIGVLSGIDIQARVTANDVLEFRVNNAGVWQFFVIRGTIWRKTAPVEPGTAFGAGAPA